MENDMPATNPFMPTPSNGGRGATPVGTPMPNGAADSFEVDLTDVESQGLIPEGSYLARCANVEQSVSKGGNPMFVWDFELLEGGGKGRILKVFTAITPAAMWKVAETVIALGVGQTGQVVKFKRSDVVGRDCGVMVADTEYNGNVRSQIQKVMSVSELQQVKAQA